MIFLIILFSFIYLIVKQNYMSTAEFTLLLTDNADFLKPFAINLTKDHEAAKDLFQETS